LILGAKENDGFFDFKRLESSGLFNDIKRIFMYDISIVIGAIGVVASLITIVFSWFISKKQGVFGSSELIISFANKGSLNQQITAMAIFLPKIDNHIVIPVPIKVKNIGNKTSYGIEITIEAKSYSVINYPPVYMSPAVTDSIDSVDGKIYYLGDDVYRRTFNISQLHPSKSIQLNNAGLKSNSEKSDHIIYSPIKVKNFEQGRQYETLMLKVWIINASAKSILDSLCYISKSSRSRYENITRIKRIIMHLTGRIGHDNLCVIDVMNVKKIENTSVMTLDKYNISYGSIHDTGHVIYGPHGMIFC